MTTLRILTSLILVAAAFSGCLGDDGKSASAGTTGASSGGSGNGGDGNTNGPGTGGNGSGPLASIKVLDNGTALEPQNGTIAVMAGVNLTFDGSESTGANLTYKWDLGNGTTAENATTVHAFAEAGNATVTLTVTDATGMTGTSTVTLVVAAGGAPSGTYLRTDKKTFSDTMTVGLYTYDAADIVACGFGVEGSLTFEWEFTGTEANGTKTIVREVHLHLTGDTTNVDSDLYFNDPTGKEVKHAATETADEKIDLVDQTLTEGKYTVVVKGCTAINAKATVTAEAVYVAA